ncbi:hypothetical protein E4P82_21070 [Candidatus Competibacter phosphatis]|uniref:TubC N-terminal docking domain-containing protein n=1 Tax=Candidatus Competibacter phosphatis TaxID=221280 RepID=A0ABX1TU21_9GAMM|nr:hypothetical protein [Candidatus Competibacter phosphatis]NMQ21480.1 hypothetical protein [Candidatus Competibacter phosphatis]
MADPFSLVRALNRMRAAGFEIRAAGDLLQVSPIGRLTDPQRAYLQANKAALLALLADAETLASAWCKPARRGWDGGNGHRTTGPIFTCWRWERCCTATGA